MIKVASLRYGVIFKKAFCHPEIFTAFVRDFTGIELEIDRVETEKEFEPPIGKVRSRFDLFAEDKKNRVIVDIQHARYKDHYDRFLYYHCSAILEQVSNNKNYRTDLQVYTLVILTSGDYHQKDIAVIDFDPKDLDGEPLKEIFHKIIYICPPYVSDKTPEPLRQWMEAINDSLDGEIDETIYQKAEVLKIFEYIKQDLISV
ncbi:MAG: PD-(D/E)XK nuclease family transposase, partial [Thiomargarita sp.]|nr:PD-(D/E)XK nuclease family transposase [Thiomargarita sp.]